MMSMIRSYNKLLKLQSFDERFKYLKLTGEVGKETFGFDRYLNQKLYKSNWWRNIRDQVIVRDGGNDLGIIGYPIVDRIIIHHMNPVSIEDIMDRNSNMFDLEYLISVSTRTHLAIHYGNADLLPKDPIVRRSGDTVPWRY